MFEKNVSAMVRALREQPDRVSLELAEIKSELSSPNRRVRTNAILKLGYLSMQGCDLRMAELPIIALMGDPSVEYVLKRPVMFVASLAFKGDGKDSVLLLANVFLKEIGSAEYLRVSTALSCFAAVATRDVAHGILHAIIAQSTHSRPYVRKKLALALFRVVEKSPEDFGEVFGKLKAFLGDGDQSVQNAATSSFLEIVKRNPTLGVPLIPSFFHLLKESKNNWLLIKVLKILGFLTCAEPRLRTKLLVGSEGSGILTNILNTTKAKSVEIELTKFVLSQWADDTENESSPVVILAIEKLTRLLESGDMNIRCLAIETLWKLARVDRGRGLLESQQIMEKMFSIVLESAASTDSTVRKLALRALVVLVHSAEKTTFVIQQLLSMYTQNEGSRITQADFVRAILDLAESNSPSFSLISDSEWYLRILVLLDGDIQSSPVRIRLIDQFRRMCVLRDRSVGLRISAAALLNRKIEISDDLKNACIGVLGSVIDGELDGIEFTSLMTTSFLSAPYITNSVEGVWGALKFVVAVSSKHPQGLEMMSQLHHLIEQSLRDGTASVPVLQTCVIARAILSEPKSAHATLTSAIQAHRAAKTQPLVLPDDLDVPVIQLPNEYTAVSGVMADVYDPIDPDEEEPSTSDISPSLSPDEPLFSIKSVIAHR
jgi:hypothetical protein